MADLYKDAENKDDVFAQDSELINKKTKAVPVPAERKDVDVDGEFLKTIAEAGINSKLDLTSINSFTTAAQTRDQIYDLLDGMCEDSTVAAILETYAEDATEYNENGDII